MRKLPYATLSLIALNIVAYVSSIKSPILFEWGKGNSSIVEQMEVWRLASAGFLHTGIVYLGINLFVLFQLGKKFEQRDRRKFLLVYLGSILLSNLTIACIFALQNSPDNFVGASGGLFGLVGAYGVLLAKAKRTKAWKKGVWLYLFVIAVLIGFDSLFYVSRVGHISGFVAGVGLQIGILFL